jgi:triacylglycerol lipase
MNCFCTSLHLNLTIATPLFRWAHNAIFSKEGPNDGVVSVASSKWGTYLGTVENVQHADLVGWTNAARYQWAKVSGREIHFKPASFYLSIAGTLCFRSC